MPKKFCVNDYIGKIYGNLKIIKFAYVKNYRYYFACDCKCGNYLNVCLSDLRKGQVKCRKCYSGSDHPGWRGYGEISKNLFSRIQREAKNRNFEFNVSIEYLWKLFLKQNRKCALTGIELNFGQTYKELYKTTASLDRIDSAKGYVENNVQWVHKTINHIKCNIPNEYFILICNLVAKCKKTVLTEKDFLNKAHEFVKNSFRSRDKVGALSHRAKQYEILEEATNKTFVVTSLKHYCQENKLSLASMRRTLKNNYFHKGLKVLRKLD